MRPPDHEANLVAVCKLDAVFRAMVARGEAPHRARRFALQCAVVLFLENAGLLVNPPFRSLANDDESEQRTADVARKFFQRWADLPVSRGLFAAPDPMDLERYELSLLVDAAKVNWSRIHPAIFGTLFQATMNANERHERGAHYTPDSAIYEHVVRPSLVTPWRMRIRESSTRDELLAVHDALTQMKILDPACGSGNFLYVAYRELRRLEFEVWAKMHAQFPSVAQRGVRPTNMVRPQQLFGIDSDPFAVELAKVTMLLGQKLAFDEAMRQVDFRFDIGKFSPFDNLDDNICCDDALFCKWPQADLIIGNPPFQSKNKMQREFGPEYVQRLRKRYPEVPGRADYCVYWFRRAHDELTPGASAGLVGTNTIKQNYSREGGLDYIVKRGGTITQAVSTMVWPGEAIVHVSVVNWTKGTANGLNKLSWQEGDDLGSPWKEILLPKIPSSLSANLDVTQAKSLRANAESSACYQGQTHGHEGFLLSEAETIHMFAASKTNGDVIFPYLIGDDLLSNLHGRPSRWVIDFFPREQLEASRYALPFKRVEDLVLPDREGAAHDEERRNESLDENGNKHHANFLKRWWLLSYPRGELMTRLETLSRYIACSRVTKRPIFEFVSSSIRPSDALAVFPFEDDYCFGILQSSLHWAWFTARCSTLTARFRYTSDTVFDSFPWPQSPTEKECRAVANAALALRTLRCNMAEAHQMNLRAMYATMEDPGKHPLKVAHAALDKAVRAAYRMRARQDPLAFLLDLNERCANQEAAGQTIVGPGLPRGISVDGFVTRDAVEPRAL